MLLILINPVQFPLPEPYFDLTPIKVTHTKINCQKYLNKKQLLRIIDHQATKLIAHTPFSA